MRKDHDFFQDREVELVYIAKRLSEAKKLEELLTSASVDYLVETDQYFGGFIFQRVRIGAFFYVQRDAAGPARQVLLESGYRPQPASV
jgi:hypothetical protein